MIEPFSPRNLPDWLLPRLESFLKSVDFQYQYTSYDWGNDRHATGFKDILSLEIQLGRNAKTDGITYEDLIRVAEWGNMRNRGRVKCINSPALKPRTLYTPDGNITSNLIGQPTSPIETLDENTQGLGPTYLSKVLRFAMPEQYGAIDTWCVRVFGEGDPDKSRHNWLSLRVRNDGYGWYIPKTPKRLWPSEYGTWINILRYFANRLPPNCPHPPAFVKEGLREGGKWTCADVEMALFAYAKP